MPFLRTCRTEKRARPEWGREMEVTFAEALDEGKILSVKDLNSGFSDPRMISLAYYEASLLVDYLVTAHGEPALRRLLRAYGQGLENEAALKEAYGTSIADLQTGFDQYLDRNFGRLRRALRAPELPAQGATADQLKQLAEANPESYPGYRAGTRMINGAWRFAYFVPAPPAGEQALGQ